MSKFTEKVKSLGLAPKPMYLIFVAVFAALDQIIKLIVSLSIDLNVPTPIIPGFVNLTYVLNTGAAFSIFEGGRFFLIPLTLIMILAGLYLINNKKTTEKFTLWVLTLITAGGIGNLIDRIFRGAVIDYIDLDIDISFIKTFAIFNFADMCVVVGGIALVISLIISIIKDAKAKK
jgi:lipoprotein signal peptidase